MAARGGISDRRLAARNRRTRPAYETVGIDLEWEDRTTSSSEDWYFCDKTLRPGEGHGRLAHDAAVVTLVLRGRLEERFRDGCQACSAWELHYKPAGLAHSTGTGPQGVRMYLLGLRGRWGPGSRLTEALRPRVVSSGVLAARALRQFSALGRERQEDEEVEAALGELLACIAESSPGRTDEAIPTWISEVRERVSSGPAPEKTLGALARRFRVHPVYLARAFRRYYGESIGALRRRLRAGRAVDLLARGSAPLADVALAAGYADQSHLCREFKRATGWSPGSFRRSASAFGTPHSG